MRSFNMTRKWIFITLLAVAVGAWAWWRAYAAPHDTRNLQDEAVALARLIAGNNVHDIEDALKITGVRAVTIIDENMRVIASSDTSADVKITSEVRTSLSSGKLLVDSENQGLIRVAVPRPQGGGVLLSMSPQKRAPLVGSSMLVYLRAALLIGYAVRGKSGKHTTPSMHEVQESTPPLLNDGRALDIACVERMTSCALIVVDEGRRVVASGEKGAALLGIDGAQMPHLIDLIDADDVQMVLALVRRAPQDDGARTRIQLRDRQYECAVFAVDGKVVLAFKELEDTL